MADRMIIGTNASPTNPTPLSAPQEQQVKDLYYKNVRAKCAKEIEGSLSTPTSHPRLQRLTHSPGTAFAQCALGRTLTMIYACRAPRLAMNSCMLQYQNQAEMDAARQEWFALAGERKAEREEHKRRVEEARHKHKEWWNLDEEGRLVGRKAEVGAATGEGEAGGEGIRRKEENRRDERGVVRGGVYRGTGAAAKKKSTIPRKMKEQKEGKRENEEKTTWLSSGPLDGFSPKGLLRPCLYPIDPWCSALSLSHPLSHAYDLSKIPNTPIPSPRHPEPPPYAPPPPSGPATPMASSNSSSSISSSSIPPICVSSCVPAPALPLTPSPPTGPPNPTASPVPVSISSPA
ncbi:hypothetical protein LEMA_P092210.1 [Plenodomus lingam JN3]|uniref:COX assembly mitochondrial protein n=1 Tax=Leptosphaeria maculans (strain JN3 / isolate v23.1.3 / race Av1-4-5-6-7-8) TaxID=985895 RepID=E5A2L6_LEPMJ|nr:hypothetical protein LEMA_P092210.1 [Plenodomus lingam JN3]CBX97812.1 hypothetical protein LEMA_P092210.1 [Plenodomus lingam JN3]